MFKQLAIASLIGLASTTSETPDYSDDINEYEQYERQGPPTWEEVCEIIDLNGDNQITYEELESVIKTSGLEIDEEEWEMIEECYGIADTDHDEVLTKEEYEKGKKEYTLAIIGTKLFNHIKSSM